MHTKYNIPSPTATLSVWNQILQLICCHYHIQQHSFSYCNDPINICRHAQLNWTNPDDWLGLGCEIDLINNSMQCTHSRNAGGRSQSPSSCRFSINKLNFPIAKHISTDLERQQKYIGRYEWAQTWSIEKK